jgi:hypothetical protein|nr:MAG TPA: minor tail protein [Caudoviricetes sp.]
MALDNNIDELQIEIGTESQSATSGLEKLTETLNKLDRIANGSNGLNKVQASLSGFTRGLRQTFRIMGSWFKESNDYVEALNLFEVSMDDASDAALEYAQRVQDLMGIDIQDWLEAQGSFNQLLEGYGLAEDKAAQMSKQLTQLGYDLSSLWNVDVDTAMKRLQSGMSGQIKGLKAWGINLSVAQLRETALAHGIELSTAKMTEAQKATLRYITLMEKTTNVQGDLARTLITPANALRIFEQQVTQARRALGNIVSVVAVKVIPVFQAFISIITKAAQALANFLGYELPDIDYSGISAGASAADDMADGLSNAADAAKKLKSYTMGFDELNVINPDSGDSSTATPMGGGYASDFGFDPSKYEYDFLGGAIKSSEELEQKLKKVLDVVLAIATGIAAWKIGSIFTKDLSTLAGVALAAAGAVLTLSGAFDAWTDGLNSSNLTTMMEGTILLVTGLGLAFGPVGAAIGAAVGSIALFATAFKDLLENGFNDNNIMAFTVVTGAVIALTAAFGPVAALLAGVALAVTGVAVAMNTDAVPAIDIFDETISDTTREKVEPFIEKLRNLDDTLAGITFTGKIIDDSVVADVQRQTAAIVEAIVNELDADRNQALSTLAPLKKALGEEAYNELLASNAAYYDTVTTKVQEGEARINEIVAQARAEERTLTQAEADEITRIRDEMQNTGIQHLSETEIEYQTIMNRLKDNATRVSLEQASEIIKNAQTTRDETIAAAQTQYATVELEAQRMLGVGAINQEQYDAILLAAQTTRDESILAAQEQYQTIYDTTTEKLGDTAKYIDSETGAIKSKWDVFCDNVAQKWTQKWTDIKTGWTEWKSDFMTSWEECKTTFKTGWDTLWDNVAQKWTDWKANFMRGWEDFKTEFKHGWASFWTGIGNFFIGLWNGLVTAVEDACNIIIDMVNYVIDKMGAILAFLGISIPQVSHIKLDRVEYLEVPAFEDGGFPDMGQFFLARESGAEMVGQIGRRTAVANNDQIVSGITNGVREGNGDLLSALFTICDRVVRSIEENGGDVVIGDETIGRANDRYQQTRGPKVSSGAFADAY